MKCEKNGLTINTQKVLKTVYTIAYITMKDE